ncbi:GntR family transcriptional regulator [Lipingzhangella halophila]|uniref:GntR family transcriptional regulator n=1 Tax=Lipingzhangella halophila TaxID=1783352 RepID=A0A7W7W061_9ACTN|nr:GntR family transcriptional regulator [Lipingzhangella halophila]MBB4929562.1 GntR family transcriptional regulator [Lipingzhangella halophila]
MNVAETREALSELVGGIQPGDPLPPERDLAARLSVSRTTLRKAIAELVSIGRLVRRHGVGTFIAGPKLAQALSATSFTEDMLARGFEPGARTLSARTRSAGAVLGRRLEVSPESEVLRVYRLRLADRDPMAIEELHVPSALVPGLSGDDLASHSFYALLEQCYGVRIATGVQALEPTVTTPEESELLRVPVHSPAFLFERTSRTEDGQVVEFVRSVYRGDRYRIVAEIAPRGTSAPPSDTAESGRAP